MCKVTDSSSLPTLSSFCFHNVITVNPETSKSHIQGKHDGRDSQKSSSSESFWISGITALSERESSAADYSVDMDTSLTFTAQKDERRMVPTQNTVNTTVSLRLTCVGVRSFHWRCPEVSPQHHPRGWGSNCRTAVATLPGYLETDDNHTNEGCATRRYNTGDIIRHVQLKHVHLHLRAPTMSKPKQWVSYWRLLNGMMFNNRGRPAQTETQQGYRPVRLYKLGLTFC